MANLALTLDLVRSAALRVHAMNRKFVIATLALNAAFVSFAWQERNLGALAIAWFIAPATNFVLVFLWATATSTDEPSGKQFALMFGLPFFAVIVDWLAITSIEFRH